MSEWDDVSKIEAAPVRIHDEQSGHPVILRRFEYAFHPSLTRKPTKKELLTPEYIKFLENRLWADALELMEPYKGFPNPRVVIQKKGFTVFAACKPKKGNIVPWEAREQMNKPLTERLIGDSEPQ